MTKAGLQACNVTRGRENHDLQMGADTQAPVAEIGLRTALSPRGSSLPWKPLALSGPQFSHLESEGV